MVLDPKKTLIEILKAQWEVDPWRNGSASDSRSEGCVFDSRRVQSPYGLCFCFKFLILLLGPIYGPDVVDVQGPFDKAEHKIQSASGPLNMELTQVPKMLSVRLGKTGLQKAFFHFIQASDRFKDSFTEGSFSALEKYKMNTVIANELSTRKEEVVVVTSSEKISVRRNKDLGLDD
ncbi:DNA/pantothenate metabolism flavoprotein, C-terminal [Trema orientale]|uniref:DNA/pantothenate metabolism flavoprotein, C-terminal n=1 Tax=Trema orientale TaxID=63057 RepID=A0A2P5FXB1_TREOI|nr:DNA/pantothenate metabolism flavoprotein, C-terminal [Trema orientale]